MKKTFHGISIMLVLLISFCGDKNAKLPEGTPEYDLAKELSAKLPALNPEENKVLVTTDDFDITSADVIRSVFENFGSNVNQLKNLNEERISSMIEQIAHDIAVKKLLLNEAERTGYEVAEAEIDSSLEKDYIRGNREQFMKRLEQNGFTIEKVRKDVHERALMKKFLDDILLPRIQVTDEELQNAYMEDKIATVRHILLMTQGKSDSEKVEIRKKMDDILAQAKAGQDFAQLANTYSEDPGSNKNGGLYENFGRGKMVKPFEEAAFNVPAGEISEIVETQYGYHILKVMERKKETKSLEEVKEQLKQRLEQEKRRTVYDDYVNDLKEKANYKEIV